MLDKKARWAPLAASVLNRVELNMGWVMTLDDSCTNSSVRDT